MMKTYTETSTYTKSYTKTRLDVLNDHFELFLRCSNMNDSDVKKMLIAVECQELDAVGIYLQEGEYRISEVEFSIDWNKHDEMVRLSGKLFDTDIGGWKKGIAPEAYISVQRLVEYAKENKMPVRSWIRVSDRIRNSPREHQNVCKKLGYNYGSSVAPWKNPPKEKRRQISNLEEAQVTNRVSEL